jgi:hypothetical protein
MFVMIFIIKVIIMKNVISKTMSGFLPFPMKEIPSKKTPRVTHLHILSKFMYPGYNIPRQPSITKKNHTENPTRLQRNPSIFHLHSHAEMIFSFTKITLEGFLVTSIFMFNLFNLLVLLARNFFGYLMGKFFFFWCFQSFFFLLIVSFIVELCKRFFKVS